MRFYPFLFVHLVEAAIKAKFLSIPATELYSEPFPLVSPTNRILDLSVPIQEAELVRLPLTQKLLSSSSSATLGFDPPLFFPAQAHFRKQSTMRQAHNGHA